MFLETFLSLVEKTKQKTKTRKKNEKKKTKKKKIASTSHGVSVKYFPLGSVVQYLTLLFNQHGHTGFLLLLLLCLLQMNLMACVSPHFRRTAIAWRPFCVFSEAGRFQKLSWLSCLIAEQNRLFLCSVCSECSKLWVKPADIHLTKN